MKVIVTFNLQYAGLRLEIARCDDAIDRVPLKPISNLFQLNWKSQQRDLSNPYFRDHLGACTLQMQGADGRIREQICIRLDRVAAFLNGVNPEKVRAQGNEDGAAFLRQKQAEWADALHDYEALGIAVNPNHQDLVDGQRKLRASLCQMISIKNKCADTADRSVLSAEIGKIARDLGDPYQPELL